MKFPSIRIEGAILAADILDKIENADVAGQMSVRTIIEGSNC